MEITISVIEEFQQWLAADDASDDTVWAYVYTLRLFCLGKKVEMINNIDFFLSVKATLKNQGARLATVSRYIAAIKKFFVFLKQRYKILTIDLSEIKCKKEKRRIVDFLEDEEIDQIRNVEIKSIINLRTRAIFEFILFSGCRISEALGIKRNEIQYEKGEVEVLGKGRKHRIVFLGESDMWLKKYTREVEGEYLFVSQYGRKFNRIDSLHALHDLGRRAGLQRVLGHHLLRKTFATNLIFSGADPRTVQEMLGHEDIETTLNFYSGVTYQRMREFHRKMSNKVGTGNIFTNMLSYIHGRKETKQATGAVYSSYAEKWQNNR